MPVFRSIVFSAALAGLIVGVVISIAQFFGNSPSPNAIQRALQKIAVVLGYGQPLHVLLFALLIIGFAFFYVALVYDARSRGAESYIKLAKEIIERQPAAVTPQPAENLSSLPASGQTSEVGPQASEQPITIEGTAEHRGDGAVKEIAPAAEMDKSA